MNATINHQAILDLLTTYRYEIEVATKQGCRSPKRGVGDPSRKRAAKSLGKALAMLGVEVTKDELERLAGLHDE